MKWKKHAVIGIIILLIITVSIIGFINHEMTRPHELGPSAFKAGPAKNLEIIPEGCYLRKDAWPTLYFKALSLTPKLTLVSKDSQGSSLKIVMGNITPDNLVMQGADLVESSPAEKSMTVEVTTDAAKPSVVEWKMPQAGDDFTFFAFGDNRNTYDILEKIRDDAIRERPLFVVNTGDLVSNGTEEQLLRHEEIADSFPVPYFPVIGNHDLEEAKRTAKPYHEIFGPTYYSFWCGPDFFVVVDNASGYMSLNQMRWLDNQLKDSRQAKLRFVLAHQPPLDPRSGSHHAMKPIISGAPLLMSILDRDGVDYFISGHIHTYYEFLRGPTAFIITGNAKGGGTSPVPFSNYVVFKVSGDKVEHHLRILSANQPLE